MKARSSRAFPSSMHSRRRGAAFMFTMLAFTIGTAGFYFTNTFLIAYTTRTLELDRSDHFGLSDDRCCGAVHRATCCSED